MEKGHGCIVSVHRNWLMKEGARDVSSLASADMVCLLRPGRVASKKSSTPGPGPVEVSE